MDTLPEPANAVAFAELHCLSNYSFLRGASRPEELVNRALELGYEALAITDECTMSGVVQAHIAARGTPLRLIVGTEIRLRDDTQLVLLARNRRGYGSICNLISRGRRRAEKGHYELDWGDLDELSDVLVLWIPEFTSSRADRDACRKKLQLAGTRLKERFCTPADANSETKSALWIAMELFREGDDLDQAAEILALSIHLKLPVAASNDVHMHDAHRKPLQDLLTSIRHQQPLQDAGALLQPNAERHLRTKAELLRIYPQETLQESAQIAAQCHFSLDELRYEYPEEVVPDDLTAAQYLRQLTEHGAAKRWPRGISPDIRTLIEKELGLINELNYEHYFLTVYDIVAFARSQNILCQGRGSAANSVVCFCLFITEVDPARMSLLFERFISKERNEPPDIDVDFEHERREEVIQYIYRRYGRHRAAIAATIITYRPRSAIRDVGKALGLDLALVDSLARKLSWWDRREDLVARFAEAGIDPRSPIIEQFLSMVNQILGFPRHLSQHVGGFVISRGPLSELVPVENAAMADRTVIQWEKDDLEALGLLKVDVLALGMLTAIRKSLDLINQYQQRSTTELLGLAQIPPEDPAVYAMLCEGDSVGVFQVESRAQMAMLPRLRPQQFYDLVIEVAIVRPGPIQGDMVHPYLRRRNGEEPVTYSNDEVRGVLERTLGVPIFQEQVIKLAMVAAGFSAGEADQLRRAMAAWRRRGGLELFEAKLIEGMLERGHPREFAERVFEQIKGFGEYGFPESHAASFALLVYISAWLKCHEPAAFCCGLLNSLPMGFYSASQLVQDARRHGVAVLSPDVMHSHWDHCLEAPGTTDEQPAIRLGLRQIKGLKRDTAERIASVREALHNRHQEGLAILSNQAQLQAADLELLARAGALKGLAGHRHQAQWQIRGIIEAPPLTVPQSRAAEPTSIWQEPGAHAVAMPKPNPGEDLVEDYARLGLTLGPHPMILLRRKGHFTPCARAAELPTFRHGRYVHMAGLITGRQRPSSAAGVLFMTLEDETGNSNIVIWQSVLERFRPAVLRSQLVEIKGHIEREDKVIHVIAGHILDRSDWLQELPIKSRDFR